MGHYALYNLVGQVRDAAAKAGAMACCGAADSGIKHLVLNRIDRPVSQETEGAVAGVSGLNGSVPRCRSGFRNARVGTLACVG